MKKPKLYYTVRRKWNSSDIVRTLKLNGWFGKAIQAKAKEDEAEWLKTWVNARQRIIREMSKLLSISVSEMDEHVTNQILRSKSGRKNLKRFRKASGQ